MAIGNIFEAIIEMVNSNQLVSTFVYGEGGIGKSTQLKMVRDYLLCSNEDMLIPIYIEVRSLSSCRGENILLSKIKSLNGDDSDLEEVENLINDKSSVRNNYTLLFIIDGFNEACDEVKDSLKKEILAFANCKRNIFIVSSRYDESDNFGIFERKLEVQPLSDVCDILGVDEADISSELLEVLSIPLYLKYYLEAREDNEAFDGRSVKKSDILSSYIEHVKSGLIKNAVSPIKYGVDIDFVVDYYMPRLAYEMDSNTAVIDEVLDRVNDPEGYRIFDCKSRAERLLKHDLFDIAVKTFSLFDEASFIHQLWQDYFCAVYIKSIVTSDNLLATLNSKIFSNDVLEFLGQELELSDESKKHSRLYALIDTIRSSNNQLQYSNVLNNILKALCLCCESELSGIDLSNLDLRRCCFIGVNCENTDFKNSLCTDECFVPVEPEEADIFAVSSNGEYFITGNMDVLNIRKTETSLLIDRLLADNGNDFLSAKAMGDDCFYIRQRGISQYVKIANNRAEYFATSDVITQDADTSTTENVPESITKFGKACHTKNGFTLVKSDNSSFFGSAYLLFDKEVLIGVCPYREHCKISSLVQDGDEIELLFKNDGRVLKSICYNEKEKAIYRKEYPSLVGRGTEYKDGTKIYFDTNNIDSFVKWYFYDEFLTERSLKTWFDEGNNRNIKISECDINLRYDESILTKNYQFLAKAKGDKFLFHNKNHLSYDLENYYYHVEFSANCRGGVTKDFVTFHNYDTNSDTAVDINKSGWYFFANDLRNVNLLDNGLVALGNRLIKVNGDACSTVYKYNLTFKSEYLMEIKFFPWREVVLRAFDEYNSGMDYYELLKICKQIVSEEIVDEKNGFVFVFARYIADIVYFLYLNSNDKRDFEDNISDEDFIEGIKHWCFPCDDGVIYFNGEYTCYLRRNSLGKSDEKPYIYGADLLYFRNGVHFEAIKEKYNTSYYYKLYDIFKSDYENASDNILVPIYDLKLFNADIDGIKGLSANVEDIIRKQTEIRLDKNV